MSKTLTTLCIAAVLLMATACNSQKPETATPDQPADTQAPAATATAPLPAASQPETPKNQSGTVIETMDSGGYTYVLLGQGDQQEWVAVPQTTVSVGDEVSFIGGMVMSNFTSKTLGRTFDRVVFAGGLAEKNAAAAAPTGATDSFNAALKAEGQGAADTALAGIAASQKKEVDFATIKVAKAVGENGYTIGEIYAKAADLDGKTITVRGKVLKVSRNIMGRNWIHLQDGTGDPEQSTHDLVVTTATTPSDEWDVVTATGVLSANKDFGAGYVYAVIVEEAKIAE